MQLTLTKTSFNPAAHWDGKILPELSGGNKVERLPVIFFISGAGTTKLSVPKLPAETVEAMTKNTVMCLEDWHIKDHIQAVSFDTAILALLLELVHSSS